MYSLLRRYVIFPCICYVGVHPALYYITFAKYLVTQCHYVNTFVWRACKKTSHFLEHAHPACTLFYGSLQAAKMKGLPQLIFCYAMIQVILALVYTRVVAYQVKLGLVTLHNKIFYSMYAKMHIHLRSVPTQDTNSRHMSACMQTHHDRSVITLEYPMSQQLSIA
jgi:hypothetical protein